MAYDVIICDWNGTLIEYQDERYMLESIARDIFWASLPLHPFRMIRILRAKSKLETLYNEQRHDALFDFIIEMFKVYNEKIIKGSSVALIHRSVDKCASREQTQAKLDYRLLKIIKQYHQLGKTTGIFSAGYEYGIRRILAFAGYNHYFDFYEANRFKEWRGRATQFELSIYKNKSKLLTKLLRDMNIAPDRVVYIGDSEDDEGCFEIVGHPVMAFTAPYELKERYARKYHVYVPSSETELADYLKHA